MKPFKAGRDNTNSLIIQANENQNYNDLVAIYKKTGKKELAKGNINFGCFLITQAYIFSLELGLKESKELHAILKSYGREE